MPTGGANFPDEQIAGVLKYYDIGSIIRIKTLRLGNRKTPKVIILTDRGKFILKRRPVGKNNICHVAFAHAVQQHLRKKGLAAAELVPTAKENMTGLLLNSHTYELFEYVPGMRYDYSAAAATNAGKQLALFHKALADFSSPWQPSRKTFHDSAAVRGHLDRISSGLEPHQNSEFARVSARLKDRYDLAGRKVNEMGFNDWPEQIVHGDWHPGNLLFSGSEVVCILDFDSTTVAPPVTDLATGLGQFSIIAGSPSPADWPAYPDQARLAQFLHGYLEINSLPRQMLASLPDLIIETMTAEAVLPIAATGTFGNLGGIEFMEMINRKCTWLDSNRNLLEQTIFGQG